MQVLPVLVLVAAVVFVADAAPFWPQQNFMDRATFSGDQEGYAQTKSNTVSDSRGITSADLEAGLLDSGRIRGLVSSVSDDGSMGSGGYEGYMAGQGGLWTNTQSLSDVAGGAVAQTHMKGLLQSPGSFAGGVGSGSNTGAGYGLGRYGLAGYGHGGYGLNGYGLGRYGLGGYGLGAYGLGGYGLGSYGPYYPY
ncbi:uncharacterized protein [Panulirus ornatus]|uniref:uncharacterized protein isoform X2 n=1 Tax=Panulirus ornatus TaxID=150431 RepID=UPI003A891314